MFGSEILDVAIGLALIFLMLSLIASGVREAVEGIVKSRAVYLERGVRLLLDDPRGEGLARALYQHPLVYSLFPGPVSLVARRFRGANLPTYIPARNFSVALLDMVTRGVDPGPYAAQQTAPALTVDALRASVQRVPSVHVQRALLAAIDDAHGDPARVRANLESWFDSAMDRVSGWYRRRTQAWLFAIGLGTALLLNVNTITIGDYLAHTDDARAALVRRAALVQQDTVYQRLARDTSVAAAEARAVYEDLGSLDLPIGWDRGERPPGSADAVDWFAYLARQILGILLTAFAIMLGAPFWFDLLNKFMVIRSTVKPHEKSPEESSEDRQRNDGRRGGRTSSRDGEERRESEARGDGGVDRAAPGGVAGRGASPPGTPGPAGAPVPLVPAVEPPHSPHAWATGDDPDEGIL
jgi:hypothetical protein